jgi:hypothetical protein
MDQPYSMTPKNNFWNILPQGELEFLDFVQNTVKIFRFNTTLQCYFRPHRGTYYVHSPDALPSHHLKTEPSTYTLAGRLL